MRDQVNTCRASLWPGQMPVRGCGPAAGGRAGYENSARRPLAPTGPARSPGRPDDWTVDTTAGVHSRPDRPPSATSRTAIRQNARITSSASDYPSGPEWPRYCPATGAPAQPVNGRCAPINRPARRSLAPQLSRPPALPTGTMAHRTGHNRVDVPLSRLLYSRPYTFVTCSARVPSPPPP